MMVQRRPEHPEVAEPLSFARGASRPGKRLRKATLQRQAREVVGQFYSNNQANFFQDRKWLVQEFPVLGEVTKGGYGPVTLLEVGAGAGNTAFPLLAMNRNQDLRLHA